jgi:hypothetical protein
VAETREPTPGVPRCAGVSERTDDITDGYGKSCLTQRIPRYVKERHMAEMLTKFGPVAALTGLAAAAVLSLFR